MRRTRGCVRAETSGATLLRRARPARLGADSRVDAVHRLVAARRRQLGPIPWRRRGSVVLSARRARRRLSLVRPLALDGEPVPWQGPAPCRRRAWAGRHASSSARRRRGEEYLDGVPDERHHQLPAFPVGASASSRSAPPRDRPRSCAHARRTDPARPKHARGDARLAVRVGFNGLPRRTAQRARPRGNRSRTPLLRARQGLRTNRLRRR